MLSDESSSDSETGRFKGRTKSENVQESKSSSGNVKSLERSRNNESNRFRRDFDRRREDRHSFNKDPRDRDRARFSRHSPVRRRHSRDRSPNRRKSHERKHSRDRSPRIKAPERKYSRESPGRSQDKPKPRRNSRPKSISRDLRSSSKDRHSRSRSYKQRDLKEKIKSREKTPEKFERQERESISLSPEYNVKKSEVFKAPPSSNKKKSESPILVDEHSDSNDSMEVQPSSYYNMIPVVVKDKSDESSEIDSSDDEKLRAKLLNLEKKLHKTKRRKHKRKHKRKRSKSKDKELEPAAAEVTSTTDIEDKTLAKVNLESVTDVTSTQKAVQKESSEEGELSSDDSQNELDIDASDLRHKLTKRIRSKQDADVCGPALPPHLMRKSKRSVSPNVEGPILPPHLQRSGNIGPIIPDDMRRVLAESQREIIKYELSDDDDIGPLPEGSEGKWTSAHKELEERALNMKIRQLDGHSLHGHQVKSREQWMLELPEGKAKYIGLEARSFRAKAGPDMSDRSSWTDTPDEKAKKAAGIAKEEDADLSLRREAKARQIANRDREQEDAVKKHKKKHKRDESLLDLHQKKLKKKKKKEDKEEDKKERRPFSRDVDLQVNRFDEAQKRSIIKKAQDLDGRFSRGEAKYL